MYYFIFNFFLLPLLSQIITYLLGNTNIAICCICMGFFYFKDFVSYFFDIYVSNSILFFNAIFLYELNYFIHQSFHKSYL